MHFAAIVAAPLALAGCFSEPPRDPVPHALVEAARVPGYTNIRFWGDEVTPAFDSMITEQYEQIRAAAREPHAPDMLHKAVFLGISGGGDEGAFTAGLLKGWTDRGSRPVFEAVTGVSTGALEAPFVFLGPDYDGDLQNIYTHRRAEDLYTNRWIFGLFGNALKGTAPLEVLVRSYATEAFLDRIAGQYRLGRRLLVATSNLDAQRPMIWDLSAIAASGRPDRRDLFVSVLLASAAIPGVFPPVKIHVVAEDGRGYDELHVDGGVTAEVVFVPPGVRLTDFEEKILGSRRDLTLYLIRNGKLVPEYAASPDTALPLAARGVATLVKYQVLSNLRVLERAADTSHAHFFFAAIPPVFDAMPSDEFDTGYAQALFACGRQVGLTGTWSTKVPVTPALVPQQTPSATTSAAQISTDAKDPMDMLCRR